MVIFKCTESLVVALALRRDYYDLSSIGLLTQPFEKLVAIRIVLVLLVQIRRHDLAEIPWERSCLIGGDL